jgi:glycosyltransferase involved in cell wall biosynthesis
MAARNAAPTITASIDSVLSQTHANLELIIVDDGSSDTTPQILAALTDPRIRIFHQSHTGPSSARNLALAHARGEYIAPIDADDIWLPAKLEWQQQALTRRPDAALAYGWTNFVDPQLKPLYPDDRATAEGHLLEELLRKNFICCGSNTLMRRTAVLAAGGFDESLQAAEDWELHTRLAARHPFAAVPEVVVLYRRSPFSLSSNFLLMERNYRAASRKIFAAAPPHLRPLESQANASFYTYLLTRTLESKTSPGKWKALPRYAALSFPGSPLFTLRITWPFWFPPTAFAATSAWFWLGN